jgi:hypothetical protein
MSSLHITPNLTRIFKKHFNALAARYFKAHCTLGHFWDIYHILDSWMGLSGVARPEHHHA